MGGKNSGRFKKGTIKKFQNILAPKDLEAKKVQNTTPVQNKPTPKIESIEENLDFEHNANRILSESNADLAAQKQKEQPKNEIKADEAQNTEVMQKPKEDWTPVAGLVMQFLGGVAVKSTGFKEMDYTKEEIDQCAPAINNLINHFFPDLDALTPEQKILLLNGGILLKVHMDKVALYFELKNKQKAEKENESKNTKIEPEQKAA